MHLVLRYFRDNPGASPFVRWAFSPVLLLFAVIFCFVARDSYAEGRPWGALLTVAIIVICLAGTLALWGVRYAGRVVSGIVGVGYTWYLIDQCFIHFDGTWGFAQGKSETTPLNSILGFFFIGLPCLLHAIRGNLLPVRKRRLPGDGRDVDFGDFGVNPEKPGAYRFSLGQRGEGAGTIVCSRGDEEMEIRWEAADYPDQDIVLTPLDLRTWRSGKALDREEQHEVLGEFRECLDREGIIADISLRPDEVDHGTPCSEPGCGKPPLVCSRYCAYHHDEHLMV